MNNTSSNSNSLVISYLFTPKILDRWKDKNWSTQATYIFAFHKLQMRDLEMLFCSLQNVDIPETTWALHMS